MANPIQTSDNPNAPIFLQEFAGLVNTQSAERLGPADLTVAKNIDIDDVKQVHRRRGYTRKDTGMWHSLYKSADGRNFGVKDGNFGLIAADYSFTVLAAGGQRKLCYAEVGDTLYANSEDACFKLDLRTGTASGWGMLDGNGQWLSPVLTPTETLGEVSGKLLRNPPRAEYMTYFNGRIYMAAGNVVWCTELYQYDYIDATKNYFMMEGTVTGLGTVGEGIYVGTDKGTFFCRGTLNDMRKNPVVPDSVIAGSMIPANPQDYPDNSSKLAVLFLTSSGLCVGFDAGVCRNLTVNRFWFPDAVSANAVNRVQDGISQYISVVDSGGAPASNARIGDYVDAEIRRFRGA